MMKAGFVLFSLLLSLPAQGDTLRDVRAAVERLSGARPVRATLTIEQAVASAGRFANDKTSRLATASISHDSGGITISIPQAMIERASKEMRSKTADGSAQDAIGAIKTLEVVAALNFRDSFLEMLDGATVVEEKSSVLRGRAARLVVLKLAAQKRRERNSVQLGSVKTDDHLRLWLGDDNLPLAAERDQKTTAGFMFINGKFNSQTNYTFGVANDRLLLTRMESTESGSGMGQKVDRRSIQTLTVHDAP